MKSYNIKNVFYIAFLLLICVFIVVTINYYFHKPKKIIEGARSLKSIGKSIVNTAKKATSSVSSAAKAAAKPIAAAAKPIAAAAKPIEAAVKPIASMAKTALTPKSVKDNSKDSDDTNEDTDTKTPTPTPASSQVSAPEPIPTKFDPNLLKEMSSENIVKTIAKQLYDIRNLSNKISELNTKTK